MVVRTKQIAAFNPVMKAGYQRRMIAHLRSRFPSRLGNTSDERLIAVIDAGTNNAKGYGITLEYDLRRYLEYVVQYGPDFDKLDWAWPTLLPPGDGTEKMDNLDGMTTFVVRS